MPTTPNLSKPLSNPRDPLENSESRGLAMRQMLAEIDAICDTFEEDWRLALEQQSKRPRIEHYANSAPHRLYERLLFHLVAFELEQRSQVGEAYTLEEYTSRFPRYQDLLVSLFLGSMGTKSAVAVGSVEAPGQASAFQEGAPEMLWLGGYELLQELGRGGAGIVYKARQVSLGRMCAVKILVAGRYASQHERTRFRTEAEAIARLNHPNIVQVYEVGEHEGTPFLSLEYCSGGSLEGRRTGPLSPQQAAQLVEKMALAMEAAHRAQVIHRDLKPGNVLLTDSGEPKIADFGLARLLDEVSEYSRTQEVVGTPSYMAPEQACGDRDKIGARSDLYSLGAILYQLLTARPPFKGATLTETLEQVRRHPPIPLRRLDQRIPRDLERVCLQCLEKDPNKRYPSAQALADELRRFLEGRPVQAREVSSLEHVWRWYRRNPVVASLTTLTVFLLLGIAFISSVAAIRLTHTVKKVEQAERTARQREAEALIGEAHGIRQSRRPGQRIAALAALQRAVAIGRELELPAKWFERPRNEAVAALALADLHITQEVAGTTSPTPTDVNPEFTLFARATPRGGCTIYSLSDLLAGKETPALATVPDLGETVTLDLGPRRLLMRVGQKSKLAQLWDVNQSPPKLCWEVKSGAGGHFRHDGQVALALTNGEIQIRDTKGLVHQLAPNSLVHVYPVLHPTAPLVAVYSYYDQVDVVLIRSLETGKVVAQITPDWTRTWGCSWSPDGRLLAIAEGEGTRIRLYPFDPQTCQIGTPLVLEDANLSAHHSLLFNSSGDRLIATGWKNYVHLFEVLTGKLLFSTRLKSSCWSSGLRLDSTGQLLGATRLGLFQERWGLWSVADGREYRMLLTQDSRPPSAPPPTRKINRQHALNAIHPDGQLVVSAFQDGLRFFDLHTGKQLAFKKLEPVAVGDQKIAHTTSLSFANDKTLFTCGKGGAFRWPLTKTGHSYTLGEPTKLSLPSNNWTDIGIYACSRADVISLPMWSGYEMGSGGRILHFPSKKCVSLDLGQHGYSSSVSADGQWAAFVTSSQVKVYNVSEVFKDRKDQSGPVRWQIQANRATYCRFTADGCWLLTDNNGGQVYETSTGKPILRLGPGIPTGICGNSRLVVMAQDNGVYRLVELPTTRDLARFEDSNQTVRELVQFEDPDQLVSGALLTPDGSRMVVSAPEGLRVWELRRIRKELAKLNFDWDAPPFADDKPAPRLTVEIQPAQR